MFGTLAGSPEVGWWKQPSTGSLIAQFQQGSRPAFGVTAVVGQRAPVVAQATQRTLTEASAAGLGAHGPFS